MLREKNEEIENALNDKIVWEEAAQKERNDHRAYVKVLEAKLFDKEKEHEV